VKEQILVLIGIDLPVFIGMTLVVMGGAALLVGHAVAGAWRPVWQVIFYSLLLGITTRFFSLALFYGDPFFAPERWLHGAIVDSICLVVYGLVAYRITYVARMASQYPWLISRVGLFFYRRIER
jgi:hypothetical protein